MTVLEQEQSGNGHQASGQQAVRAAVKPKRAARKKVTMAEVPFGEQLQQYGFWEKTPKPKVNAASIKIGRHFTKKGQTMEGVFDSVEWETRDAVIGGNFRQEGVEFPAFWSQNATNIVANKYFRGKLNTPEREWSVRQMIGRVVKTSSGWGARGGYFRNKEEQQTFEAELAYILLHQLAAFNSPVWFNVGFEDKPQCSACFILSVEDSMESLLDWIRREGIIFRGGSGSGTSLSRLRSSKEQLSKGGYASGPVSFMRGADASAGTIKSGGKTRRAAKMVVLDVDHPDILEFIWCKALEERKARGLELLGYDMGLDSHDQNLLQYQNANNSVRATDEFMEKALAKADWELIARTDGKPIETVDAFGILHQIASATWESADPGVQYDTTINRWHTTPAAGRIRASNPCSEYMSNDDTACNLASLNLMKFRREDGELDVKAFEHAVDIVFTAMEILVGYSSYPTPEIERNAHNLRQLGLGYANLGALLMARGLAYDSEEARAYAAAITALMTGRAYRKSAEIARRMGPFLEYDRNKEHMLNVVGMHRDESQEHPNTDLSSVPADLRSAMQRAWDEALAGGKQNGYRNAQATVLAPTGTISFLMDCDTTGVEPDFSLVKSKKLVGGGEIRIVNQTVALALEKLGYPADEIPAIVAYVDEHNSVVGAPYLRTEHYPVFDCAVGERAIHYSGHVRMMGAIQPFISGAISKTVNMPEEVTIEDVMQVYLDAWQLGVKAIAIYRDNCKVAQPLTSGLVGKIGGGALPVDERSNPEFLRMWATLFLRRFAGEHDFSPNSDGKRRLPQTRPGYIHAVKIRDEQSGNEYTLYFIFGLFPEGNPGEVFIISQQVGTSMRGLMDGFGMAVSKGFQQGRSPEKFIEDYIGANFAPRGRTDNPDIVWAESINDYAAKLLAVMNVPVDKQIDLGLMTREIKRIKAEALKDGSGNGSGLAVLPAPVVSESPAEGKSTVRRGVDLLETCSKPGCGGILIFNGVCKVCNGCGDQSGCVQ
jgi:ribonucleoside-diphosphate reductase alpha chain